MQDMETVISIPLHQLNFSFPSTFSQFFMVRKTSIVSLSSSFSATATSTREHPSPAKLSAPGLNGLSIPPGALGYVKFQTNYGKALSCPALDSEV